LKHNLKTYSPVVKWHWDYPLNNNLLLRNRPGKRIDRFAIQSSLLGRPVRLSMVLCRFPATPINAFARLQGLLNACHDSSSRVYNRFSAEPRGIAPTGMLEYWNVGWMGKKVSCQF
jgi:hypothetical protein